MIKAGEAELAKERKEDDLCKEEHSAGRLAWRWYIPCHKPLQEYFLSKQGGSFPHPRISATRDIAFP